MAWPPTLPTGTRQNLTSMEDLHPLDHNLYLEALNTIIAKVGSPWTAGSSYPSVDDRFGAYGRSHSLIVAHENSHSKWVEVADVIMSATDFEQNSYLLYFALTSLGFGGTGLEGGGDVYFAPISGTYYKFSPVLQITIPEGVNIHFAGGLGKGSGFYGYGNIDPTNIQAHFAGGLIFSSRSSLTMGSCGLIMGSSAMTTAPMIIPSDTEGVIISGNGPGASKIYRYAGLNQPLILLDGSDVSHMPRSILFNGMNFSGGDGAYDAFHFKFAKLIIFNEVDISSCSGGIYAEGWWDSFMKNMRFDYASTKGHSSLVSSPTIGSTSHIRGAITLINNSSVDCNNIQADNITFETIGDVALFSGPSAGNKRTNKCYWSNIKLEDVTHGNCPMIYLQDAEVMDFKNLDFDIGGQYPGIPFTSQPLILLENCDGTSFDGIFAAWLSNHVPVAISANSSGTAVTISTNLVTTYGTEKFKYWRAYITDSGGTFKSDVQILSYTSTILTVDAAASVVSGDLIKIYCPNVSSVIETSGTTSGIDIDNVKLSVQPYHYPMLDSIPGPFGAKAGVFNLAGNVYDHHIGNVELMYDGTQAGAVFYGVDAPPGYVNRGYAFSGAGTTQINPRAGDSIVCKISGGTTSRTLNLTAMNKIGGDNKEILLYLYNMDAGAKTITITSSDGVVYFPASIANPYVTGVTASRCDLFRLKYHPRFSRIESSFWTVEVVGQTYSTPIPLTP